MSTKPRARKLKGGPAHDGGCNCRFLSAAAVNLKWVDEVRPGFTVVSNRCLTNKAMLVLVDELNLL